MHLSSWSAIGSRRDAHAVKFIRALVLVTVAPPPGREEPHQQHSRRVAHIRPPLANVGADEAHTASFSLN